MGLGYIWDTWEVQSLPTHLLTEWKRPHPQLTTEHLLHILQPDHIVLIWRQLKSTISQSPLPCGTKAGILHLFVFHLLDRGQVVVQLNHYPACQWDQCYRDRQGDEVGQIVAGFAQRCEFWCVIWTKECP